MEYMFLVYHVFGLQLKSFSTNGEEHLKLHLKSQARKSMEHAQDRLENERAEQLHFMHTKVR